MLERLSKIFQPISKAFRWAWHHPKMSLSGLFALLLGAGDLFGLYSAAARQMSAWFGADWLAIMVASPYFRIAAFAIAILCFLRIGVLAAREERKAGAESLARINELAAQKVEGIKHDDIQTAFNSAQEGLISAARDFQEALPLFDVFRALKQAEGAMVRYTLYLEECRYTPRPKSYLTGAGEAARGFIVQCCGLMRERPPEEPPSSPEPVYLPQAHDAPVGEAPLVDPEKSAMFLGYHRQNLALLERAKKLIEGNVQMRLTQIPLRSGREEGAHERAERDFRQAAKSDGWT